MRDNEQNYSTYNWIHRITFYTAEKSIFRSKSLNPDTVNFFFNMKFFRASHNKMQLNKWLK